MRARGPRQEVAYLALAVAVLAIAVALFAGVRALPRKPKPAEPTKVAQAPPQRKPVAPQPKPGSTRDPFAAGAKVAAAQTPATQQKKPEEQFKLVGLVRGKEPLAVIRRGERRYYVHVGGSVGGYTLAEIGADRVILTKGDERVALPLHVPKPQERQ